MTILKESTMWKAQRRTSRLSSLTYDEAAHVRKAIRALLLRLGSQRKLAAAIGVNVRTLQNATYHSTSAGLALRVARVAHVPVEDVLAGRFPRPGECPMCGHIKETP